MHLIFSVLFFSVLVSILNVSLHAQNQNDLLLLQIFLIKEIDQLAIEHAVSILGEHEYSQTSVLRTKKSSLFYV